MRATLVVFALVLPACTSALAIPDLSPGADLASPAPTGPDLSTSPDFATPIPDLAVSVVADLAVPRNGCNGLLDCLIACKGVDACNKLCLDGATAQAGILLTVLFTCLEKVCPSSAPDGGLAPCAMSGAKCDACRTFEIKNSCAKEYLGCVGDKP